MALLQIHLLQGSPVPGCNAKSFFEEGWHIAIHCFYCIVEGEQEFLIDAEEITERFVSERAVGGGFLLYAVT